MYYTFVPFKKLDKCVLMVPFSHNVLNATKTVHEMKHLFKKEYREVFSFFDRDGGGTITSVELGQVMRTFGWSPTEGDLQVESNEIALKANKT